jgi:hypothetical protein
MRLSRNGCKKFKDMAGYAARRDDRYVEANSPIARPLRTGMPKLI